MKLLFLHAAGSSGDVWAQQRLAFAGHVALDAFLERLA